MKKTTTARRALNADELVMITLGKEFSYFQNNSGYILPERRFDLLEEPFGIFVHLLYM